MNAAKTGFIAEFKTGYLQREIKEIAKVTEGEDAGLRDVTKLGYAPGRLVKITESNGVLTIQQPDTPVSATSIGDATHIIAQSDDTIRELPEDYNYTERYSTMPNGICKNTSGTDTKTVALYKIINSDDIKIVDLD